MVDPAEKRAGEGGDPDSPMDAGAPLELPIDGVLDLHTFPPRQVKDLVLDYLALCRERGILEVRVVHGKGRSVLRQTVQSLLAKHPDVVTFAEANVAYGGWGATMVRLRPADPPPGSTPPGDPP